METTKSYHPSLFKSPTSIEEGPLAVAKSTFAAKLDALITPVVDVFLKIEMVFEPLFTTTISSFPSASISDNAIATGFVPVIKSTFAAKLPALTDPAEAVFLKIEMVFELLFATTISTFPSPSKSPNFTF